MDQPVQEHGRLWAPSFRKYTFYGVLWFSSSRLLQDDLKKDRDHWNSHKISKSTYSAIDGVPDVMFFFLNIMHMRNVKFLYLKKRRRRWKYTA